jgi:hypothetical protein
VRRVVLLALVGPLLAGCTGPEPPSTLEQAHQDALGYLAALPPGSLAAYLVETAAAAGLEPAVWPPRSPALGHVVLPPDGTPYAQSLRPAFALTFEPGIPQAEAIRARVLSGFDGTQFGEPGLLNDDLFALWTLARLGDADRPEAQAAVDHLLTHQDLGWSWSATGEPDTDTTAMVLSALHAAGALDRADRSGAVNFFTMAGQAGDGYGTRPGADGNCNSTVWVLRAQGVLGVSWVDHSAWEYLLALQGPDGGFAYTPGGSSNAFCTAEAATVLGLARSGAVLAPRAA